MDSDNAPDCDCAHEDDEPLYLRSLCQPSAPTWVRYQAGMNHHQHVRRLRRVRIELAG